MANLGSYGKPKSDPYGLKGFQAKQNAKYKQTPAYKVSYSPSKGYSSTSYITGKTTSSKSKSKSSSKSSSSKKSTPKLTTSSSSRELASNALSTSGNIGVGSNAPVSNYGIKRNPSDLFNPTGTEPTILGQFMEAISGQNGMFNRRDYQPNQSEPAVINKWLNTQNQYAGNSEEEENSAWDNFLYNINPSNWVKNANEWRNYRDNPTQPTEEYKPNIAENETILSIRKANAQENPLMSHNWPNPNRTPGYVLDESGIPTGYVDQSGNLTNPREAFNTATNQEVLGVSDAEPEVPEVSNNNLDNEITYPGAGGSPTTGSPTKGSLEVGNEQPMDWEKMYKKQEKDTAKEYKKMISGLDPIYAEYQRQGTQELETQKQRDLAKLASLFSAYGTSDSEQRMQQEQRMGADYATRLSDLMAKLAQQKQQDVMGYEEKRQNALSAIAEAKQNAAFKVQQLMAQAAKDRSKVKNPKTPGVNSGWQNYQVQDFINQMLSEGYSWQDIADTASARNIDTNSNSYLDKYLRNYFG